MQNLNKTDPFETLAVLLYNDGLLAAKQGRLDDAANSLCTAESLVNVDRVSSYRMKISIAACKVFFALGQFDKAEQYLETASQCGISVKILTRMRGHIENEKNAALLPPRKSIEEMFVSVFGGRSWIDAFCDWLEAEVHKVCQGTTGHPKNMDASPDGKGVAKPVGDSLIPAFLNWLEKDVVREFCKNLRGSFPRDHH